MVRKKVDQYSPLVLTSTVHWQQNSRWNGFTEESRSETKIFYVMFFLHFWRAKLTYVEFLLKWAKKNYWNKTRLSQNCRWWILLVRVLRLEVCVLDFSDASRVENSIFEESRLSTTFVSLCNYLKSEMQSLKKKKGCQNQTLKGRCNNFTISRCWLLMIVIVKSQDEKRVKISTIKSPNFTLLKGLLK